MRSSVAGYYFYVPFILLCFFFFALLLFCCTVNILIYFFFLILFIILLCFMLVFFFTLFFANMLLVFYLSDRKVMVSWKVVVFTKNLCICLYVCIFVRYEVRYLKLEIWSTPSRDCIQFWWLFIHWWPYRFINHIWQGLRQWVTFRNPTNSRTLCVSNSNSEPGQVKDTARVTVNTICKNWLHELLLERFVRCTHQLVLKEYLNKKIRKTKKVKIKKNKQIP